MVRFVSLLSVVLSCAVVEAGPFQRLRSQSACSTCQAPSSDPACSTCLPQIPTASEAPCCQPSANSTKETVRVRGGLFGRFRVRSRSVTASTDCACGPACVGPSCDCPAAAPVVPTKVEPESDSAPRVDAGLGLGRTTVLNRSLGIFAQVYSGDAKLGRAIVRMQNDPVRAEQFQIAVDERFGVEPETIVDWLQLFLKQAPQIIKLILLIAG